MVTLNTSPVSDVQSLLARYTYALKYTKDQFVGDLGCGTGFGSWLMAQQARSVLGIDPDTESIAMARDRYFVREKTTFVNYSIEESHEVMAPALSVIVSFNTLERLKDVKKWEKRVDERLPKGGKVIYSVLLSTDDIKKPQDGSQSLAKAKSWFAGYEKAEEFIQVGQNLYSMLAVSSKSNKGKPKIYVTTRVKV